MSILPFDLTEVIHAELQRQRRPNDGLLHASAHLTGSLRHAQLDVAGAPQVQSKLIREFPLWIGQMMHDWLHDTLRRLGVPYLAEVNLNPWLPRGWGGTADAFIWNPELRAFVLTDFKSQKGEGMRYIVRDGAKPEHKAQTSVYWHGAKKMGIPLAKAIGVFYLPKNDTRSKDDIIEPVLADFEPMSVRKLNKESAERFETVQRYEQSLSFTPESVQIREEGVKPDEVKLPKKAANPKAWLTDELEPVQEREQRVYFDRKTDTYELKLVPHWSAAFCPFPDGLCDCSTQGTTKIGLFDVDGTYHARPKYEHIEPAVFPGA